MTIDLRWNVPKQNQLWLKWKKIIHTGTGLIKLINPTFYGPVLADCLPLEQAGELKLDLTKHFIVLIPTPYEISLSWSTKAHQSTTEIVFPEMTLKDDKLGLLNILKQKDTILIDCTGHTTEEAAKGKFKLSFAAMIYNEHKEPYDLTK